LQVVNTDKEFTINMDVRHFKPEELKITAKDNRIIVEAKHEEQQDEHGYIAREFRRQYVLPKVSLEAFSIVVKVKVSSCCRKLNRPRQTFQAS
jgi:HSP20 family molecular chaperone IbpA